MATTQQKLVVGNLIENGGNVYQAMIKAGYSKAYAHNSHKMQKSVGFKEAAAELGLTEDFLTRALVADINAKPQKRTKELELGYKVLGTTAPSDTPPTGDTYNTQINLGDTTPRGEQMVDAFTQYMLKQTLPKKIDGSTGN